MKENKLTVYTGIFLIFALYFCVFFALARSEYSPNLKKLATSPNANKNILSFIETGNSNENSDSQSEETQESGESDENVSDNTGTEGSGEETSDQIGDEIENQKEGVSDKIDEVSDDANEEISDAQSQIPDIGFKRNRNRFTYFELKHRTRPDYLRKQIQLKKHREVSKNSRRHRHKKQKEKEVKTETQDQESDESQVESTESETVTETVPETTSIEEETPNLYEKTMRVSILNNKKIALVKVDSKDKKAFCNEKCLNTCKNNYNFFKEQYLLCAKVACMCQNNNSIFRKVNAMNGKKYSGYNKYLFILVIIIMFVSYLVLFDASKKNLIVNEKLYNKSQTYALLSEDNEDQREYYALNEI